jgi:hypothetical protein
MAERPTVAQTGVRGAVRPVAWQGRRGTQSRRITTATGGKWQCVHGCRAPPGPPKPPAPPPPPVAAAGATLEGTAWAARAFKLLATPLPRLTVLGQDFENRGRDKNVVTARTSHAHSRMPVPQARRYTIRHCTEIEPGRGCWQATRDTARPPSIGSDWAMLAAPGRDAVMPRVRGTYPDHVGPPEGAHAENSREQLHR